MPGALTSFTGAVSTVESSPFSTADVSSRCGASATSPAKVTRTSRTPAGAICPTSEPSFSQSRR
jgi:hypothetical protein